MVTTVSSASSSSGGRGISPTQGAGLILMAAGAANSAIGAFFGVQAQRYQLQTRSLDLEFQASTADINARLAERDAAALLEAGTQEIGLTTLRFGQIRSAARAQQAAAGVQAGVGSAAEVQASIELAKDLESLTIERNALRAAGSARFRALDFRSRAELARVSAASLREFRQTLSPGLATLTSLIGSAGAVAPQFIANQTRAARAGVS